MIKPGETFYAIEKETIHSRDLEGYDTTGRVHGPFVCTSADSVFVRSEGRNFAVQFWTLSRANKKLLQKSCT